MHREDYYKLVFQTDDGPDEGAESKSGSREGTGTEVFAILGVVVAVVVALLVVMMLRRKMAKPSEDGEAEGGGMEDGNQGPEPLLPKYESE